ncbi:aKG-HExxH-type peptide beta-hydroxylase [Streptomyces beigongshangae]|uniref:aKG-HExxH-type peptide beta-hydroxylase n=1 Tax=Streptomyces beigongshangae TaxID=2841597 RepID=UPI001C8471A0|nr:HEXXH motif-containing putative peptide modification protein [Streptomyces sp. REN17]
MSSTPSAAQPVTDRVARADTMLCADRQFGDSTAIGERNLARFRLGLTMLARHDDGAADVLRETAAASDERLRPLLYDPVLRNCFEVDLARLDSGRPEPSSLAPHLSGHAATPAADTSSVTGPCEALMRPHRPAWPGLGDAWVLAEPAPSSDSGPQEMLAERLMQLYRDALGDNRATGPVTPTDEVLTGLRDGAELLATLLPAAGAGVLGHVTMVGFTHRENEEGPLQSMSGGDPLPSTVLLAPERCASPWLAAESLLHEGAHLKLFDALRTGSVVKNATEQVPIPWRIGSWTVIRVFVALHFYVHLLVFRAAAEAAGETVRERFGPPPPAEDLDEPSPGTPAALGGQYRTSEERARYLAECVLSLPEEALTENGHRFARWLLTALRLVDEDAPRPRDRDAVTTRRAEPGQPQEVAVPGRAPQRVAPVDACALPGLGQLVVSPARSARMHWLNARSWTVYSLCDGRDLASLHTAYARAAGLPAGSGEVERQVGDSLRLLESSGLVLQGG